METPISLHLQEDLADSGVVVVHGRVNRKKPYLNPNNTIQHQRYATEYLQKPDAVGNKCMFGEKKRSKMS